MQYLTSLIAVIAVWIAYQQFQTARQKLKLDLYDKRFGVFQTVFKFIGLMAAHQKPTAEDIINLDQVKLTSFFLFGPEIPRYIQTIRDKAESIELLNCQAKEISELGGGDLLIQSRRSQNELLVWFDTQIEECRRVFGGYLTKLLVRVEQIRYIVIFYDESQVPLEYWEGRYRRRIPAGLADWSELVVPDKVTARICDPKLGGKGTVKVRILSFEFDE